MGRNLIYVVLANKPYQFHTLFKVYWNQIRPDIFQGTDQHLSKACYYGLDVVIYLVITGFDPLHGFTLGVTPNCTKKMSPSGSSFLALILAGSVGGDPGGGAFSCPGVILLIKRMIPLVR